MFMIMLNICVNCTECLHSMKEGLCEWVKLNFNDSFSQQHIQYANDFPLCCLQP